MKLLLNCLLILSLMILALSCGEGVVEVTQESYEPKIVIDGRFYKWELVSVKPPTVTMKREMESRV